MPGKKKVNAYNEIKFTKTIAKLRIKLTTINNYTGTKKLKETCKSLIIISFILPQIAEKYEFDYTVKKVKVKQKEL
jgi:hypothetical protein